MDVALAGVVFLVTYGLIATDRIDKTLAALLGGLAMIVLRIIDQEIAFHAIDFNVIFLLAGMMVLAGILRRTGFFQFVAIRSVKLAGGDPFRLLVVLSVVTAGLSAVLEESDGTKSYWALAHCDPEKPDFHLADCFTAKLA